MSTRFKRFYPDVEKWKWDELRSRSTIQEIDYEPHFDEYDEYIILNEDARVSYEHARSELRNLIAHSILIARCRE